MPRSIRRYTIRGLHSRENHYQATVFRCLLITVVLFALVGDPLRAEESADLAPLVELLGQVDDAAIHRDVLRGIHAAVQGRRKLEMPTAWPNVARKLSFSNDAEVRRQTLVLSLLFGDREAANRLRMTVADKNQPAENRRRALAMLVQTRQPNMLRDLWACLDDAALRESALAHFAEYDSPEIPGRILKQYPSLTVSERRTAVATLASRPEYARELLDAVARQIVPSQDISAFTARQILALGDDRLAARLKEVWGAVNPTSEVKSARIAKLKEQLTEEVLNDADVMRGRLQYKQLCAGCHRLYDDGGKIGPDLTGSQRRNLDYLLTNLVDPNALVGRDYKMTLFVTVSGRTVSGVVQRETKSTVTIRTPTETILLPTNEIDLRKPSDLSLMPEGIVARMSTSALADLVAYLISSQQVPLIDVPSKSADNPKEPVAPR